MSYFSSGDDGVHVVVMNRPQAQFTKPPPPRPPLPPAHTTLKQPSRPPPPKRSKPTRPPRPKQSGKGPDKTRGKIRANSTKTMSITQEARGESHVYNGDRDTTCYDEKKRLLHRDDRETPENENSDKNKVFQVSSPKRRSHWYDGDENKTPLLIDDHETLGSEDLDKNRVFQISTSSKEVFCTAEQIEPQNVRGAQLVPRDTCNIDQLERKSKDESYIYLPNTQETNQPAPQEIPKMSLPEHDKQKDECQLDTLDASQLSLQAILDQIDPQSTESIHQIEQDKSHDEHNLEPATLTVTSQQDPRIIYDAIPLSSFISYQQLPNDNTHASYLTQYIDEMRAHAAQLRAKGDAIVTNTCVDACSNEGVLHERDGLDKPSREGHEQYHPLASTETYLPITATVK